MQDPEPAILTYWWTNIVFKPGDALNCLGRGISLVEACRHDLENVPWPRQFILRDTRYENYYCHHQFRKFDEKFHFFDLEEQNEFSAAPRVFLRMEELLLFDIVVSLHVRLVIPQIWENLRVVPRLFFGEEYRKAMTQIFWKVMGGKIDDVLLTVKRLLNGQPLRDTFRKLQYEPLTTSFQEIKREHVSYCDG